MQSAVASHRARHSSHDMRISLRPEQAVDGYGVYGYAGSAVVARGGWGSSMIWYPPLVPLVPLVP